MSELIKAAIQRNKANEAFREAFRAEMASLKPMHDDEEFNEVLDALSARVQEGLKRDRGMDSMMHNLMCQCVHGSFGDPPSAFEDLSELVACELMARFAKRYRTVKATLSRVMREMPGLDRGCDGFGDLVDSLPLAGRAVVDEIVSGKVETYKQLEKALEGHPLKKFILFGENYVEMRLEDALEKAYLSVARGIQYEQEEDLPREDPHCVVQMVPIKERDWGNTMGIQLNVVGPFRDHHEAKAFVGQGEADGMVVQIYKGVVQK